MTSRLPNLLLERHDTQGVALDRKGTQFQLSLLTPRETAEALGCSVNSVYRLIAQGELRVIDIAPAGSQRSKMRISRDDLRAFIDSRTQGAAS
jgi:excisionase family DNA binding protein